MLLQQKLRTVWTCWRLIFSNHCQYQSYLPALPFTYAKSGLTTSEFTIVQPTRATCLCGQSRLPLRAQRKSFCAWTDSYRGPQVTLNSHYSVMRVVVRIDTSILPFTGCTWYAAQTTHRLQSITNLWCRDTVYLPNNRDFCFHWKGQSKMTKHLRPWGVLWTIWNLSKEKSFYCYKDGHHRFCLHFYPPNTYHLS